MEAISLSHLISQGDAASDVTKAICFYEDAKRRISELAAPAAADLLCKLSSAYIVRGLKDDVVLAAALSFTATCIFPDVTTYSHFAQAKVAVALKHIVIDRGGYMKHALQEAMLAVDKGLELASTHKGLLILRTEISHLIATLKSKSPSCDVCNKPAENRCSRCGLQTYCSPACQRSHWPEHKLVCRAPTRPVDGSSGAKNVSRGVPFIDAQTFGYYPVPSSQRSSRDPETIAACLSACETSLIIYTSLDEKRVAAIRNSAATLNAMETVPFALFASSLVGSLWVSSKRGIAWPSERA
jgi:hypothetical protein